MRFFGRFPLNCWRNPSPGDVLEGWKMGVCRWKLAINGKTKAPGWSTGLSPKASLYDAGCDTSPYGGFPYDRGTMGYPKKHHDFQFSIETHGDLGCILGHLHFSVHEFRPVTGGRFSVGLAKLGKGPAPVWDWPRNWAKWRKKCAGRTLANNTYIYIYIIIYIYICICIYIYIYVYVCNI